MEVPNLREYEHLKEAVPSIVFGKVASNPTTDGGWLQLRQFCANIYLTNDGVLMYSKRLINIRKL